MRAWTLVLLLGLAGCGTDDEPAAEAGAERIEIVVDAEGAFEATLIRGGSRDALAEGDLLRASGAERTLGTLRDALQRVMATPARRDDADNAVLEARLTTAPETPWKTVQWLLMTCADPGVKIWRISIRENASSAFVRVDLPRDEALRREMMKHESGRMRIKLFRKQKADPRLAFTRIRVGDRRLGHTLDLPRSEAPDPVVQTRAWQQVAKLVRAHHDPDQTQIAELVTPPPDGGDVPAADAVRVLRLFREVGYAHVHLEGAPPPLPDVR
ncbi:MAG: hypothetical protein QNJ98_05755 [Planctomycetota bacterium]|nr:hypothetical protein [Planctomycetota bacterium]